MTMQLVKFAFSGGLATAFHWLVMVLMINAGIAAFTATAVGAFVGAILNYFLQRNVTFQSEISHQLVLIPYLLVGAQIWITNLVFFYILHHLALLSAVFAQGSTTFIVAASSYFLYKRVVFNDRQS